MEKLVLTVLLNIVKLVSSQISVYNMQFVLIQVNLQMLQVLNAIHAILVVMEFVISVAQLMYAKNAKLDFNLIMMVHYV